MRIRTPADLAALIRDRRRQLGLDQRELAARVKVSRQWIVDIERGKPGAAVGLVLRTLDALGIPLSVGSELPSSRRDTSVDINAIVEAARRRRK